MSAARHCTHCQKTSGTAYSLNIVVASNQFSVDVDTLHR
ncbi:GFA family protein [uncultured Cycloclasticus sp.]